MAAVEADTLAGLHIQSRNAVLAQLHARADALHLAIMKQAELMVQSGFAMRHVRVLMRLMGLAVRIYRILHKADMAERNAPLEARAQALREKNLKKMAKRAIQSHAKDSPLEKIDEFRVPARADELPLRGENAGQPPLPKPGEGKWPPHAQRPHKRAA